MAAEQDRRPRGTRDETTAAILDAAEGLFARQGYTAVSVREIAAAAGVSHALVHRYLGPKQAIYRAVLKRQETQIADAAEQQEDLSEVTGLMLRRAWLRHRTYLRLVAHSALHDLPYAQTSGRFVATERLVELAERAAASGPAAADAAASPRFVIASLVAMLLGWSAAKDWVLPAAGLQGMSEEEFLAAFEEVALRLEQAYLPSSGKSAGD